MNVIRKSTDKQRNAVRICVEEFNVLFYGDLYSFDDCREFLNIYFPRYKALSGKPKYLYKVEAIVYGHSTLLAAIPFCSTYQIDKIRKLVKDEYNATMGDFKEKNGRVLAETDSAGITIELGILPIL